MAIEKLTGVPAAAEDAYPQKRRVTLVGAAANLLLAAGKVAFGILGHSQALVADGIHSLSDLLSDVLVLVAARLGSEDPDAEHPYGHGRFETVATVAVGVLLLAVAAGFIYDATLRLMHPSEFTLLGWIVLPAAIVSVLVKEALYQYTVRVGRRVRSALIEANAWHHRSDALSSLVVIGGVLGVLAGFPWLDAAAAIVVALMVAWVGAGFVRHALRELVDTGLEPEELSRLRQVIDAVDGVRAHHDLRTRRMAGSVLVDVHILVDRWVSVSEGHRIAEEVRTELLRHIDEASDVLVHVDVESPQMESDQPAPLRRQVLADLQHAWRELPQAKGMSIVLHYHGRHVQADVLLQPDAVEPAQLHRLAAELERAAAHLGYLDSVHVMLATRPHPRRGGSGGAGGG